MFRSKVLLIIFLSCFKNIYGSDCDGADHTFSFAKAKLCKFPFPCFFICSMECSDTIVDGCVEDVNSYRIEIISSVTVLRRGAFRNLPEVRNIELNNTGLGEIEAKAFQNTPNCYGVGLAYNKLRSIRAGVFSKNPFTVVDLTSNRIDSIDDYAFAYMDNLGGVLLGNNSIEEIKGTWFFNSPIRTIILAHNKLKIIRTEALEKLNNLVLLDVSFNEIFRIDVLPNLTKNITVINLSGNNLTDLNFLKGFTLKILFAGLNKISYLDDKNFNSFGKANVEKIFVHPNPWQCICLKKFETLMRVRNITVGLPSEDFSMKWNSEHPICVEGEVKRTMCNGIVATQVESGKEAYFSSVSYDKFIKYKSDYGVYGG